MSHADKPLSSEREQFFNRSPRSNPTVHHSIRSGTGSPHSAEIESQLRGSSQPSPIVEETNAEVNRAVTDAYKATPEGMAESAGVKQAMQAIFKAVAMENSAEDWESQGMLEVAKAKRKLEELEEKKASKSFALMLTVNTKRGTTLEQLKGCVSKWLVKKHFNPSKDAGFYLYCYEKFGRKGEHLHVHFLFLTAGKKFSEWKRESQSTFGSVCDPTNKHCLNLIQIPQERFEQECNYIKGQKSDPDKMDCVLQDQVWRKSEKLENFYEQN